MGYKSIAIDGPSGAGKSTLARKVAQAMGYLYVDTGAIYRTLGLAALRRGEIDYLTARGRLLVFRRTLGDEQAVTAINAGPQERRVCLPWAAQDLITGEVFRCYATGESHVTMPPMTGRLLVPWTPEEEQPE